MRSSSSATFSSFFAAGGTALSGLVFAFSACTSGRPSSSIDSVTVTSPDFADTGPCARSASPAASIAHSRRIGSG